MPTRTTEGPRVTDEMLADDGRIVYRTAAARLSSVKAYLREWTVEPDQVLLEMIERCADYARELGGSVNGHR